MVSDCSNRMEGNVFKSKEDRFRLGMRNIFFHVMVARHWNSLPIEVVIAPSLGMLKARLDVTVSSLG